MDNDERRRYFRIDEEIIFHWQRISLEERTRKAMQLNMNQIDYPDPDKFFLMLESDLNMALQNLKVLNPEVAKVATLINRKLNLIAANQHIGMRIHLFDKEPQKVNISACGLAFQSQEKLDPNEPLLVEMLLLPQKVFVQCIADVVSCEETGPNVYQVNVDFNVMREEDREQLIQHIVQKEMQQLQLRKKQEGK